MKKSSLTVLLIVITFVVNAQDYYNPVYKTPLPAKPHHDAYLTQKFSIAFAMGAAFPGMDAGSTNINTTSTFWNQNTVFYFTQNSGNIVQGFAQPGFHMSFSATYMFTDLFGLHFNFGQSYNNFNINSFQAQQNYPFSASPSSLRTTEFLLGPYFSFQQTPKLSLQVYGLVGVVVSHFPALSLPSYPGSDTTYSIALNTGYGFGATMGCSMQYSLNETVKISLGCEYTFSKITYTSYLNNESVGGLFLGGFQINTNNFMQESLIKPKLGIVINLL